MFCQSRLQTVNCISRYVKPFFSRGIVFSISARDAHVTEDLFVVSQIQILQFAKALGGTDTRNSY